LKPFPARVEYQKEWIKEFVIQISAEMLSNDKFSVRSYKTLINLPVEIKEKIIFESMHKVREFQFLVKKLKVKE